jgi:hypothetical protein
MMMAIGVVGMEMQRADFKPSDVAPNSKSGRTGDHVISHMLYPSLQVAIYRLLQAMTAQKLQGNSINTFFRPHGSFSKAFVTQDHGSSDPTWLGVLLGG